MRFIWPISMRMTSAPSTKNHQITTFFPPPRRKPIIEKRIAESESTSLSLDDHEDTKVRPSCKDFLPSVVVSLASIDARVLKHRRPISIRHY